MYICTYIHMYRAREREREREEEDMEARAEAGDTLSPPTKSLGFRGFDSSKLLILKGENSHAL